MEEVCRWVLEEWLMDMDLELSKFWLCEFRDFDVHLLFLRLVQPYHDAKTLKGTAPSFRTEELR